LYSLPAWTPAFLMRDFGATPAQVGIQYGLATLITGCLGVLVGPWLSRLLVKRYPLDAPIRTAFVAAAGAVLPCVVLAFAGSYWIALAASVAGGFFVNLSLPVAAAALQSSAPNRMRGLVTSAYALVLSSVGLGVAPTLVALVTDKILHDPKSVGIALGCVCAGAALLALPLLRGAAERATVSLRQGARDS
jgi:MFS family permease